MYIFSLGERPNKHIYQGPNIRTVEKPIETDHG
jgi:hypothetical protein